MSYVSKIGSGLERSRIRKMNELKDNYENVIAFTVGEPDFATPSHIVEAAVKALKEGKTKYAPNDGVAELRKALSAKIKQSHGIEYDWDKEIVVTPSGMDTLRIASLAVLDPDDEMIIAEPCWSNHPNHPGMAAGKAVLVPVLEKDGFMYDMDTLEKYITDKTKVILLNSPSNPTGGVITYDTLVKFCQFCEKHDLIIFSDEVYEKIIYDGLKFYSPAMIEGMKKRVVICNSFSKTYAMTGWRLGYGAGPQEIIHAMQLINENSASCVATFVQYAGIEALTASQDCVEEMRKEFEKRRDMVYEGINAIKGLSMIKPKGAFYAFINIEQTGLSSEEFALKLLERKQVCIVGGDGFGKAGEGFVRISYATSRENIVEGLRRIKEFMEEIMSDKL